MVPFSWLSHIIYTTPIRCNKYLEFDTNHPCFLYWYSPATIWCWGLCISTSVGSGVQEVGIRAKHLCWSVVIQSHWDRILIDAFIIGVHRQVITGCTPDSLGSNVSASSWWDWSEFDQCRSATGLMSRLMSVLLGLGYLSSLCNTPGTWTNSLC